MNLERQVFDAGVVGAGGAGFPTYKKLVPGVELLVVNAAECEPLLASDQYLMRHNAAQIIAGIQAVVSSCGIPRAVIGTKSHYVAEIAALREAIADAGAAIEIVGVDSFFPAGDEQVLIYEITGRTVPPGGIPLDVGIVVMNVTTLFNVADATAGRPVTRKLVTVTGQVRTPVVVDAPVGSLVSDLIDAAGGVTADPYVIVRGGPMMGKHYPMSVAATLGFGKADGGLVVLPATHPLVRFVGKPLDRLVAETKSMCIQCQMCTDLCPRHLIGHQMRPHRVMRAIQSGLDPVDLKDALLCCECGICELYACPMELSPRRMNIYAKGLLRAQGIQVDDRTVYPDQTDMRDSRRIPQHRLIDRWQLSDYPTSIDDLVRLDPSVVSLPTKHGVGQAATPCVVVGDVVRCGQVVAEVPFGNVGAPVHASIDGRVVEVTDDHVTIKQEGM